MSSNLNEVQNATVGCAVGCIEVVCLQPLNYMKNMVQQNQPINLSPKVLYRGVGSNVINMGGCTTIQFAFGGLFKKQITNNNTLPLTPLREMSAGIGAGVVSALFGTPLELLMIQQQRKGQPVVSTLKSLMSTGGPTIFGRGFVGAAVREGLWTCGYLSIPPVLRKQLRELYPDTFDSDAKARVPASLLGGLFACYLTHPFDTVKTCMQGDVERKTYSTFSATAKTLYAESGVQGFYRGATFRYGRMVIAVGMMDYLQAAIAPVLFPEAFAV